MKKRSVCRLLQPSLPKNAEPVIRAEAERKLAEVLGCGNKDLYALYVHKRTKLLSISEIRSLVVHFTDGGQYEFEKMFERLFGGRPSWEIEAHPEPKFSEWDYIPFE